MSGRCAMVSRLPITRQTSAIEYVHDIARHRLRGTGYAGYAALRPQAETIRGVVVHIGPGSV